MTLVLSPALMAQVSLDQVNLENVPYRKVRSYIIRQQEGSANCPLSEWKASLRDDDDESEFHVYTKTYIVKEQKNKVWSTYLNTNPTSAWNTRKSAVALLYFRDNDELKYATDSCEGSRSGQMMFLNLRLMKGLYHLATVLEITDIQDTSGTIDISYVEHGINRGKQRITMEETEDGYTRITHTSIIKSDSEFRDRYLYPYFHNKLINAFHRNMRRKVYANATFRTGASHAG